MQKTATLIIILFLITGLLFPVTSGSGRLRGLVLDESTAAPLAGVTVKLYSVTGRAFHKPFPHTGEDGKWKAFSVRGGEWYIDFSHPGYVTQKITYPIDTRPGSKTPLIKILLKKIGGLTSGNIIPEEIGKAVSLYKEGKFHEALRKFDKISETGSASESAALMYKFIGNCYAGLKDEQKAIAAYEKALPKFPEDWDLILSIGNAYMNAGNQAKALEYFNRIPFDKIDNCDTLYNIGIIHYNRGEHGEALKYLKKTTVLNNTFAEGFFRLGMTYTALNEIKKAILALQRFMLLAPDSPDYQAARTITDAFSDQPRH